MVWDVENNAGRERYFVKPTKSHTLRQPSYTRKDYPTDIYMYSEKAKDSKSWYSLERQQKKQVLMRR